jgi:hypothetical protein
VHFSTWSGRFFTNPVDSFFPGVVAILLTAIAVWYAIRAGAERRRVVTSGRQCAVELSTHSAFAKTACSDGSRCDSTRRARPPERRQAEAGKDRHGEKEQIAEPRRCPQSPHQRKDGVQPAIERRSEAERQDEAGEADRHWTRLYRFK